jgi:hypothetical protein
MIKISTGTETERGKTKAIAMFGDLENRKNTVLTGYYWLPTRGDQLHQ